MPSTTAWMLCAALASARLAECHIAPAAVELEGGAELVLDPAEAGRAPRGADHVLLQVDARGGLAVGKQLACRGMKDVERTCSSDGCTVLADRMQGRSCRNYCGEQGYSCVAAWEEVNEDCAIKYTLTCDESGIQTSDLLCQCAPPGIPPMPPALSAPAAPTGEPVPVSTFFWNVHWECSMAARGASRACKNAIGHRFVELAREANAEIVASVELSDSASEPASLINFGLSGWTQVNGPCASGDGGDAAALAFAPGWEVQASGGGCLRHDWDTRAFAVARVTPPSAVKGCPSLCVVAIHAPHSTITRGKDIVRSVCGGVADRCAMAMGDWNVPGHGVGGLWADLIGGAAPSGAHPDQRTCCFPESHHYGVFDHLATNIEGAQHSHQNVHPYQLLELNPVKQHKAVAAHLILPGA